LLLAREGRLLFLGAVAILLVVGGVGTFIFFRNLAYGDLFAARQQINQLQTEGENLRRQVNDQNVQINTLQAKLTGVQAALQSIMPSANTYKISPNQSLAIAGGHLIIGLVGSPSNESVTLNINGKQQTAVAGQIINVAPDPSMNCEVGVQTFDMFTAVLGASCAAAKPQ
jgi:hypothetical protein